MDRVFFWHYEAAEDQQESTEAKQLSPEDIMKVDKMAKEPKL